MSNPIIFRILHLSDFHFTAKKKADQELIVAEMLKDLRALVQERKVDLIAFSGDLVFSGSKIDDFHKAQSMLLNPVRDLCQLEDGDIVICPGNHDLDRQSVEVDDYLEDGLRARLTDTQRLNDHIDRFIRLPLDDDRANLRLKNYFSFVRGLYHESASLKTNYVDCLKLKTQIGKVGIAVFNSAWRSCGAGEVEREKLLLADRVVQIARDELRESDLKLAVFHHPLEWLAPWNMQSVRTPLFAGFDVLMFGHVHDEMPNLQQNAIGNCLFAQSGCLFESPQYWNGYQILDLSIDDGLHVDMTMRTWYNRPRGAFGAAERICEKGRKAFQFRSGGGRRMSTPDLLRLQGAIDVAAEDHLRTLQLTHQVSFEQSFTCPPLSYKTHTELAGLKPKDYKGSLVELKSFGRWDGTFVFIGSRESGKTTLSFRVAKDVLQTDGDDPKIPIRTDFGSIRTYDSLEKIIRRSISGLNLDFSASRIAGSHRCLFLVDNVKLFEIDKVDFLKKLIASTAGKHDWILFVDQLDLLTSDKIKEDLSASHAPIFIQPYGRTQIRTLVTRIAPSHATPRDVDTVIKLIDDNQLPRSAYIVTLIYSVLQSAPLETAINEATLLDRVVDLLLNKVSPSNIVRSSTDFAGLNLLLEEIAIWYMETDDNCLSENRLLQSLAKHLTDRGILQGAGRILDGFVHSGVLEKRGQDVYFRYRSFQSFFLAKYAARHRDFAPKLLEGFGILRFAKEFSLLCDLSRHDQDLLTFLEVVVVELRPAFFEDVLKTTFIDARINESSAESVALETMEHISDGPQTPAKIDEIGDFRDRAMTDLARRYKKGAPDVDVPEPLLYIAGFIEAWRVWGRAIAALDFVELSIRKPSFFRLIDQWTRIASAISKAGSDILQELFESAEREGRSLAKEDRERIEYIARINMPISSAQAIFSHIGSASIHKLLLDSFDEMDIDSPDALGALCMLIKLMPEGWEERVRRYISTRIEPAQKGAGIVRYFVLEALSFEYIQRVLDPKQVRAIQELLAQLLADGGFTNAKTQTVLNRLRQDRVRLEALAGGGKVASTR